MAEITVPYSRLHALCTGKAKRMQNGVPIPESVYQYLTS